MSLRTNQLSFYGKSIAIVSKLSGQGISVQGTPSSTITFRAEPPCTNILLLTPVAENSEAKLTNCLA